MAPDIAGFYDMLYGTGGIDLQALCLWQASAASGSVWGSNPPYTLSDFLAVYPKFFGPATAAPGGTITTGTASLAFTALAAGAAAGQLITGPGLPGGTTISSISGSTLTLSNQATATETSQAYSIYTAPVVPLVVLQLYINLALASIMQARWQGTWLLGMALFIAHYTTLYMQSESATPNTTAAQVAASGLQKGIAISKAVGDVSAGYQPLQGLEDWGSFQLTTYGVQLATIAQAIAAGPIYIW